MITRRHPVERARHGPRVRADLSQLPIPLRRSRLRAVREEDRGDDHEDAEP
jgi:hypothetical protein